MRVLQKGKVRSRDSWGWGDVLKDGQGGSEDSGPDTPPRRGGGSVVKMGFYFPCPPLPLSTATVECPPISSSDIPPTRPAGASIMSASYCKSGRNAQEGGASGQ